MSSQVRSDFSDDECGAAWAEAQVELRRKTRVPDEYLALPRVLGAYPLVSLFVSRGVENWHAEARGAYSTEEPVGWRALRERYSPEGLCGWLAWAAGLQPEPRPTRPAGLAGGFAWDRVATADQVVRWTGEELVLLGPPRPQEK